MYQNNHYPYAPMQGVQMPPPTQYEPSIPSQKDINLNANPSTAPLAPIQTKAAVQIAPPIQVQPQQQQQQPAAVQPPQHSFPPHAPHQSYPPHQHHHPPQQVYQNPAPNMHYSPSTHTPYHPSTHTPYQSYTTAPPPTVNGYHSYHGHSTPSSYPPMPSPAAHHYGATAYEPMASPYFFPQINPHAILRKNKLAKERRKEKKKNVEKLTNKIKKLTKAINQLSEDTEKNYAPPSSSKIHIPPPAHEVQNNIIQTPGERNRAKHVFDNTIREVQRLFLQIENCSEDYRFETFELISQCTFLLRGNLQDVIYVDKKGQIIEVEAPVIQVKEVEIPSIAKKAESKKFSTKKVVQVQKQNMKLIEEVDEEDEDILEESTEEQEEEQEFDHVDERLEEIESQIAAENQGNSDPLLKKVHQVLIHMDMPVMKMFRLFCGEAGTVVTADTLMDVLHGKNIEITVDECERIISSYDRNMTKNLYAVEFEEMVHQILGDEHIFRLKAKYAENKNIHINLLNAHQKSMCKLIVKTLKADQRPITKVYKELLTHSRNDFLYSTSLVKGLKIDYDLNLDAEEVAALCQNFDQDSDGMSRSAFIKFVSTARAL